MKSSREQFEEWFKSEHEEVENSQELSAKVMKMISWSAWQASRVAIEITIPDCDDYESTWQYQDAAEIKIKALGLTVK